MDDRSCVQTPKKTVDEHCTRRLKRGNEIHKIETSNKFNYAHMCFIIITIVTRGGNATATYIASTDRQLRDTILLNGG
jgi:hypothetical protein